MKTAFMLIPLLLCVLLCCNKSQSPALHNEGIIGKWKLAEHYYSTGGPVYHQTLNPLHPSIIQFYKDGRLTSNDSTFVYDHYKLLNDSMMELTVQGSSIEMRYALDDTLRILPPCYEACGYKYIPAR